MPFASKRTRRTEACQFIHDHMKSMSPVKNGDKTLLFRVGKRDIIKSISAETWRSACRDSSVMADLRRQIVKSVKAEIGRKS